MEPTGSKRNWSRWARLLGFQGVDPPAHTLVTLAGDERWLREHWHGAEGLAGGTAGDSAGGIPRVTIQAGPAGCYVDGIFNADSGVPENVSVYFDVIANLRVGGIPAATWNPTIRDSNPSVPTKSLVWFDAALSDALAGISPDPVTGTFLDAFQFQVNSSNSGGRTAFPWTWWIEPNQLLVFLYHGSEFTVGLRLREPAASKNQ